MIQLLLEKEHIDSRTHLMVSTLQAQNYSELSDYTEARNTLVRLVTKLISEDPDYSSNSPTTET